MAVVQKFEATEANILKLERLWGEIQNLMPDGRHFGDNPDYENRCRQFLLVLDALPKIDGWKPQIDLYEAHDIAQMRLDAHEVGDAEAYISVENRLSEPGKHIREYRFRFDQKRKELVRDAVKEHIALVDADICELRGDVQDLAVASKISTAKWDLLRQHIDEINVLLGSSIIRPRRWADLRRHLSFGLVQDFIDIENHDWPEVKAAIADALFGEDEPIPVGLDDLSDAVASKPQGPVTTKLNWNQLDDEEFERLLFRLISHVPGYENPEWLMNTNAADKGRDLSVTRVMTDALSGTIRQRVIVQCKHWLTKPVGSGDIATIMQQMKLWDEPPVDVLIITTSGRFSADAVTWIEKHNAGDTRLKIDMWPESHLERLLAARPALIAEFALR